MTSTEQMARPGTAEPDIPRSIAWVGAGLFTVFALALVAGSVDVVIGAWVAGLAFLGTVLVGISRLRGGRLNLDLGLIGVLLMVGSPLVPARLGLAVAGVGVDDIPMLLGVLVAGFSVLRAEGWRGLSRGLAIPMYAFAAWNGTITIIESGWDPQGLSRGLGRWTLVALAFSIALTIARRDNRSRVILGSIIVIGLAEALFGIWAYLLDWTVESGERAVLIGLERWREYQLLYADTPGRISGTLGVSSNFFGGLMLIPSLLAAGWFERARGSFERIIFAAATAALVFGLVLSYTRSSLIALVVGAVLAVILTRSFPAAAMLGAALGLALVLTPMLDRFSEENDRLSLTQQSIEAIRKDPGTGLGSGEFVEGQFDEDDPRLIATSHNSFLLAAAETGIPGGILFLVATVLPGALLVKRTVQNWPSDPILAATCGGTFAFGVQALSNNLFHIPGVAVFYWAAAAAALGLAAQQSREPSDLGGHEGDS